MKLQGKTILIAEDEADLRELLIDVFNACGAEAVGAENGTIAFAMAQKQNFDAVVTDIRMPGGDGVTLIKNINQHLAVKPKIFVCSAFNDLNPEDFVSLGVVESFGKPFKRNAIIDAVAKALNISS